MLWPSVFLLWIASRVSKVLFSFSWQLSDLGGYFFDKTIEGFLQKIFVFLHFVYIYYYILYYIILYICMSNTVSYNWAGLNFLITRFMAIHSFSSTIFAYPATLGASAYFLVRDLTPSFASSMLIFLPTVLSTCYTNYNWSPSSSCLHFFPTQRCICLIVYSSFDGASTHSAEIKVFRSFSCTQAVYDVGIITSFNCLPFSAIYFRIAFLSSWT